MHHGVHEFYKPSGSALATLVQYSLMQAFGFIKFIDSVVHAYNYYLAICN